MEKLKKQNSAPSISAGRLNVVYYTDPLCCWSWTFETAWKVLQENYSFNIRYCMGGLLADWKRYHDPLNAVSKPLQMGPIWMQARQLSGTPINDKIWFTDPPASSYPACVAVKCASLQSAQAEEVYLYQLREAVMLHGKNIARKEVLLEVAAQAAQRIPEYFNIDLFERQLTLPQTMNAFKADLQEIGYKNITRFPTLMVSGQGKKGALIITGNRPYEAAAALLDRFLDHG